MAYKILLVDDEPDFLSVVRMRLSKAGYDVICAKDGKDALDHLRLKIPDIIITDVMMPVMDGIDLFQELRNRPDTKDIPIIVITVKDRLEASFKAVGVDEFIAKPFEIEDLLKKVQKCLFKKTATAD
ncbi:MAG: response regulator [Candidatus Omnitrophota bacterium]